MLINHALIMCR